MLPFLLTPWALFGLLAVPALAAIYLLRNRFKQLPVSSLMFWLDQKEAREGGLRVRRLQTPLLFFLELLALGLLVGAAAGPTATTAPGTRPLVVVLDDSFSMLAGGDESPRRRAGTALVDELRRGIRYSVRFVLAGEVPQVLGEPVHTVGEAAAALAGWKCRAPTARLEEAIGLATELGGDRAIVLVLSDHAPGFDLEKGKVQWWAYGEARPNLAFVNAARTSRLGQDRCLLEIANLSLKDQSTPLVVKSNTGQVLHRATIELAPGKTRRVFLQLKEVATTLHASLGADALPIDNEVILLREDQPAVRVELRVKNDSMKALVEKALKATGRTLISATRPDLLFTDESGVIAPRRETWLAQFLSEKEADSYLGPFVMDRNHPLTDGLSLQGVVWGGGKTQDLAGMPIVLAGNVPLMTDSENDGRHDLLIRLRPDLSTLQDTPQWPILIANIVQWRASQMPGLNRANFRLGDTAILNVPAMLETVDVIAPGPMARQVPVQGKQAMVRADEVALYELQAGESKYAFAVNALNRNESNLSECSTGQWGEWTDETGLGLETQNLAWVLLLLAALILTVHMMLVSRQIR